MRILMSERNLAMSFIRPNKISVWSVRSWASSMIITLFYNWQDVRKQKPIIDLSNNIEISFLHEICILFAIFSTSSSYVLYSSYNVLYSSSYVLYSSSYVLYSSSYILYSSSYVLYSSSYVLYSSSYVL